jgi:hypothetical protein
MAIRRRTLVSIAIVLAVLGGTGWVLAPYTFLPHGTSTISLWYAEDTFHQCSRITPEASGPYWIPTSAEIDEVDHRLWNLMEDRARAHLPIPRPLMQYKRQYIGFTRNGERLIYVNIADSGSVRRVHSSLLERPENMCDGGDSFWGIVYHPKTQQFDEPEFNGAA